MASAWRFEDAKNRFDEVVDAAVKGDPQVVMKNEQPVVVILPFSEYQRVVPSEKSLAEFLLNSPLAGSELKF